MERAISISLNDENLWSKLKAGSVSQTPKLFKATLPSGGPIFILSMNKDIKMIPFVRTKTELFETTAKNESQKNKFKVVINGPTYGLTLAGKMDALSGSDPVSADNTIQEGQIIRNKKVIGGTKSNMFYIANYLNTPNKYQFGQGVAPQDADAALGNMGPLIINGLPYGRFNKYNPKQPDAKISGEPSGKYASYLEQRSNARFNAVASQPNSVGKIMIGFKENLGQLLIIAQPDNTLGIDISGLKGIALHLGLSSAVYLDGSDSVLLMINNKIIISQGSNKNETNVTGIGFSY